MIWSCKKFDALSPDELYAILQLRAEVFVVEQDCVFLDADNRDQDAHHVMGFEENKLMAYSRILRPGISYVESSIGRVVTSPKVRNRGVGKILMEKSIEALYSLYGNIPIRIGAQYYLKDFYASFGFKSTGDIYLEDGIQHIIMLLEK